MKTKLLLPILLLLSGCSDVVSDEYATYELAQQDHLFDRGWLPDILPSSTSQIEVNNDLDINTSEGSFVINEPQLSEFIANLTPTSSEGEYHFTEDDKTWAFKVEGDSIITYTLNKAKD
ncbi:MULTISPECIES: hypothetical protein [unclassified Vibrio]|uniref:hypothetical protein n=1 Tax=unclassified Vibrio TaxID=2614977 RepID=UPI00159EB7E1|nr:MULTISPECIES: hypothetical protein [unclassified Vibrio]NVN80959.1 hypothetical protein [Vibrio sp. Scap16]QLE95247.1 hypothetical protein FLM53_19815 [Vibrio sp. Scap24]